MLTEMKKCSMRWSIQVILYWCIASNREWLWCLEKEWSLTKDQYTGGKEEADLPSSDFEQVDCVLRKSINLHRAIRQFDFYNPNDVSLRMIWTSILKLSGLMFYQLNIQLKEETRYFNPSKAFLIPYRSLNFSFCNHQVRPCNSIRVYADWKVRENHIKITKSLESQGIKKKERN